MLIKMISEYQIGNTSIINHNIKCEAFKSKCIYELRETNLWEKSLAFISIKIQEKILIFKFPLINQ